MKLLVDADLLVYRCGFAAEKATYYVRWLDPRYDEFIEAACDSSKKAQELADNVTQDLAVVVSIEVDRIVEPVSHALANIRNMMADITATLDGEPFVVLSGGNNFRNSIATIKPYKGNRDPEHKPVHGPAIKAWLRANFDSFTTDGEEADDYLGYTQCAAWPGETVLVTVDKDLNMIPGLHYNFLKSKLFDVTLDEADRFFWYQMLTGDATDNIPGVPGLGERKAAKLLDKVPTSDLYREVRASYVLGYGDKAEEALLENGRLLWIRRKEGEIWQPPS